MMSHPAVQVVQIPLINEKCRYWKTKTGCARGSMCKYLHAETPKPYQQYRVVHVHSSTYDARDQKAEQTRIYFRNLPKDYTRAQLHKTVKQCGFVQLLKLLPSNLPSGKQSGFVHMRTAKEAEQVVSCLEQICIDGVSTKALIKKEHNNDTSNEKQSSMTVESKLDNKSNWGSSTYTGTWDTTIADEIDIFRNKEEQKTCAPSDTHTTETVLPTKEKDKQSTCAEHSSATENVQLSKAAADDMSDTTKTIQEEEMQSPITPPCDEDQAEVPKHEEASVCVENDGSVASGIECDEVDSEQGTPFVCISNDGNGNGALFAISQAVSSNDESDLAMAKHLRNELVAFYATERKKNAFCGMNWEEMLLSENTECHDYASYLGVIAKGTSPIGVVDLHALCKLHTLQIVVHANGKVLSKHGEEHATIVHLNYDDEKRYMLLRLPSST